MYRVLAALALLALAAARIGAPSPPPPVRTVPRVDLSRYLGTWYEIARFPQAFERDCFATTAHYALKPNGDLEVVNRCRKGSLDGQESAVKGRAWVVDKASNSKLKVSFVWPFSGDYWILELDPDYRWALVGSPDRRSLWILSRTPAMDPDTYLRIVSRAQAQGFDVSRLERTVQQ